MRMHDFKSVDILGVRVEATTIAQAITAITAYAASDSPAVYVTKPYVEFLDAAYTDPEVRRLLNRSALNLPDGVALQWAAHYLKHGHRSFWRAVTSGLGIIIKPGSVADVLPERAAGVNFTWPLLEACQAQGLSVYLIGHPKNGAIQDTTSIIQRRLPDIRIAGTYDGYRANTHADELIGELATLKPDIILVGTGFPRQERLMSHLADRLRHGVLIGEGGTFDYQSFGGRLRRAPKWIRAAGLEWLWRLLLQPWRLRRQLAIPRFVWRVWRSANTKP